MPTKPDTKTAHTPGDAERLFYQPARVGQVIWLPGAVADGEALPEVFEVDFVEYLPEKAGHILYVQLPELARFAGRYPEPWDVADALRNKSGFLVKAETPNKDFRHDGSASYSWGYSRFSWLYAATEGAIVDTVLTWAKSVDAAALAKAEGRS